VARHNLKNKLSDNCNLIGGQGMRKNNGNTIIRNCRVGALNTRRPSDDITGTR